MIPKTSPECSGAIKARLSDLRHRKAALDEAIASLERYASCAVVADGSAKVIQMKGVAHLAGAA